MHPWSPLCPAAVVMLDRLISRPQQLESHGALVLILASLLSIAVLAIVAERKVRALGEEISQVSDPARASILEIQYNLAMETAGTRGYLLTGDAKYAEGHRVARTQRKKAMARLEAVTQRSPAPVRQTVKQMHQSFIPADALLDSLFAGQLSRAEYMKRLPAQQERLTVVTAAAHELGDLLASNANARLAYIKGFARRAATLIIVLVALALVAALLVARLGLSFRRIASSEHDAWAASEAARAEADRRREETERIADSRARLMRGFTHDVKNPLTATSGILSLLDEGVLDPLNRRQKEAVTRARRSLSSALSLIDDLLELAHAETGEIRIRRAPVDLREIARNILEEQKPLADAKGLSLVAEPGEPVITDSDAERVRQVLSNLISNAVKYTPAGNVTVRAWIDNDAQHAQRWARVDVADTGPGLSESQTQQLFQEFHRLDTSRGIPGTGLGLAISKRIANALGGEIIVSSEAGAGSTFSFLLPCGDAPTQPLDTAA